MKNMLKLAAIAALCITASAGAADPVPGIDISLQQKPGSQHLRGQSDARGKFTTHPLAEGAYEITMRRDTMEPVDVTITITPRNAERTERASFRTTVFPNDDGVMVLDLVSARADQFWQTFELTAALVDSRLVRFAPGEVGAVFE